MKVQTLSENLIKALTGIKENKVNIGNVVINRKPLLEALKINKKFDLITLETGKTTWPNTINNANCLRISLDHTVMTFLHQNATDNKNPNPAKLDFKFSQEKEGIPLDTRKLIEAISFALSCTATDDTRPELECVKFECKDNKIKLIGADGFRLAIANMNANKILDETFLIDAADITKQLLPFLKAIKPTGKGKSKEYPETFIKFQVDTTIKFSTDNGHVTLDRQAYEFPEYEHCIPEKNENYHKVEFQADDLIQAVDANRSISDISRLQFKKVDETTSKCELHTKSEDIGNSITEFDARVNEDCKIALSNKYLKAFLNFCKHNIITGYLTHYTSPVLFELPDGKIEVIMPMDVNWD